MCAYLGADYRELDEISRLIKKYGGTYEMTPGAKQEFTVGEERDASIWLVLHDELKPFICIWRLKSRNNRTILIRLRKEPMGQDHIGSV